MQSVWGTILILSYLYNLVHLHFIYQEIFYKQFNYAKDE
jgi:hypothetical protein